MLGSRCSSISRDTNQLTCASPAFLPVGNLMTASTTEKTQTSEPLADREGPGEFDINRVSVVGLGHMGHAFAVNLVEDGHQVVVYDRDPERTTALRASGASSAAHLNELAGCDVVLTSLPDDDALAAVALGPSGLVGILSPTAVHISTSTVSPTLSRRIAEEHASHSNESFARARVFLSM
jgi:hypothetical protein